MKETESYCPKENQSEDGKLDPGVVLLAGSGVSICRKASVRWWDGSEWGWYAGAVRLAISSISK
ncbi:MAG: hypothetical protein ACK532_06630 [Acidobacteriota bacterium]|jgi:hypothetical protein